MQEAVGTLSLEQKQVLIKTYISNGALYLIAIYGNFITLKEKRSLNNGSPAGVSNITSNNNQSLDLKSMKML